MESLTYTPNERSPYALTEEQILAGALGHGMDIVNGQAYQYVAVNRGSGLLGENEDVRMYKGKVLIALGFPTRPEIHGSKKTSEKDEVHNFLLRELSGDVSGAFDPAI